MSNWRNEYPEFASWLGIPEPEIDPPSIALTHYDEKCGAKAEHGPCALPKGHNMGNADVPSSHQASPTDAELEKQADHIYDTIHTEIYRMEWRDMYKKIVRDAQASAGVTTSPVEPGIPYSTGGETAPVRYPNPHRREDDGIGLNGGAPRW